MYDHQKMFNIRKGIEHLEELDLLMDELVRFCDVHSRIFFFAVDYIGSIYAALLKQIKRNAKAISLNGIESSDTGIYLRYSVDEIWEELNKDGVGILLSVRQRDHLSFCQFLPQNIDMFYTTDDRMELLYTKFVVKNSIEHVLSDGNLPIEVRWRINNAAFCMLYDKELYALDFFEYDNYNTNTALGNVNLTIIPEQLEMKDTGIVLQGPIRKDDDFTLNTCIYYRSIYPNVPIIVSTWNGETDSRFRDELEKYNIWLIEKKLPADCGFRNVNWQITSSLNGIRALEQKTDIKYVLKIRTDACIKMKDFLVYFKNLVQGFPTRCKQLEGRIMLLGAYGYASPFYAWDYLAFGTIHDLEKLYFIRSAEDEDPEDMSGSAEVYIYRTFYKKYVGEIESSSGNVTAWIDFLRDVVVIADASCIEYLWPKYWLLRHKLDGIGHVNFARWFNLFSNNIHAE